MYSQLLLKVCIYQQSWAQLIDSDLCHWNNYIYISDYEKFVYDSSEDVCIICKIIEICSSYHYPYTYGAYEATER